MQMNPISQFAVKKIFELEFFGLDISLTNASVAMLTATFLITILSYTAANKLSVIPDKKQTFAEIFYNFMNNMLKQYAGVNAAKYLPLIISIFLIILMGNLLGLIPGIYTFTSQITITLSLALIVFISVIWIGIKEQGLSFFKIFIHSNMPLPITLFIIPIEIVSFVARPISLCLRLCINMIAGHMMLKIFAGFAASLPASSVILVPLLVVLTLFEVLVAVLQAYIFAMLSCIYLSDAVNSSTTHA